MDLQIKVQKDYRKEICYMNQRNFQDFKQTTEKFLLDNFHNIAQMKIINYIFENIYENLTDEIIQEFNELTKQMLQRENNKEIIK